MKRQLTIVSRYMAMSILVCSFAACSDDNPKPGTGDEKELSEEYYSGGKLGTTFNQSASAYEDPTVPVEEGGMSDRFKYGEYFFERAFNQGNKPFNGLGPLYVRNSCISCHPGYGHGRRMDRYRANDWGNGYLLVVYDRNTNAYLSSLTGMPQTKAVEPFKAPLDEEKIQITWPTYTDEWGNKFDDGETYELIYPEVKIPESAFYVPIECNNKPLPYADVEVRLESTIGIYGTGLLDAIDDADILAQYKAEEAKGAKLNPAIFANGDFVKKYKDGHVLRYTYALSRGPLQDGPGANAIWNITNVTRSDRRSHYMTEAYAKKAMNDKDVQDKFYEYFPDWNKTGNVANDIYNYLMNKELPVEMTDDDYVNFYIWHRGLAVPAARNLDDPVVKRGKELFTELGCTSCHRPSWTTGDDNFTDPNGFFKNADARLPRYPHQKIWPYTDMVQHRLMMPNDIRTGWCRTTPLWGRGLALVCSGHQDRMHDCRARNVLEAIMWHGCPGSDARWTVEKFRKLSKADRDAVVEFINAI